MLTVSVNRRLFTRCVFVAQTCYSGNKRLFVCCFYQRYEGFSGRLSAPCIYWDLKQAFLPRSASPHTSLPVRKQVGNTEERKRAGGKTNREAVKESPLHV